MACSGFAIGFAVEVRLGYADDLTLYGRYQYDPVVYRRDHFCCPACAIAGITDRVHMSQVIQGRFADLHA